MKKHFLYIFLVVFCFALAAPLAAQDPFPIVNPSFEDWDEDLPVGWVGDRTNVALSGIVQYSDSAADGDYAVQLIRTGTSHGRFTTQAYEVDAGFIYEVTFWVRGQGDIRAGLYDGGWHYESYIAVDSDDWAEYSQSIVAANSATDAEFMFSIRNTDEARDHLQLDNVSITYQEPGIDEVSDIAELRTKEGDGQTYILTGGATITLQGDHGRNQRFIQDETGGILIDDNDGVIQQTLEIGDVVENLTGRVSHFANMVQFIPTADDGVVVDTGVVPDPLVVEIADLDDMSQDDAHQGILITVENVTYTGTDTEFAAGQSYPFEDGEGDVIYLRTNFSDLDYIGEPIPTGAVNLTGVHSVFGFSFPVDLQIVPRSLEDIEDPLTVDDWSIYQ